MKAKTISILLVVILAALACLHLDDFDLSNSTAEATLLPERPEEASFRTYVEAVTVNITVDGLDMRLFERKIRECTPWGYDEGVRLGIPTRELFDCVYESLSEKAKEKYDRDEANAMIDIALDNLVDKRQIEYDHDNEQWRQFHTGEYRMKHWAELTE